MREFKFIWLLVIGIFLFTAAVFAAGTHKFVGVATCKMCHKAQYDVWVTTKHSKAMETLKSEAAAKFAKEKGLTKPAAESEQCLKCHETAFGVDAALLDAKFDKSQGVQCEACHGAGGDYKVMATMKDKAKAAAAGLTPIAVADGSAEKHCVKCHNAESPTFKGFNFQESWAKIKHPKPAK